MRLAIILAASLLLAACVALGPPADTVTACAALKAYTAAQEAQMAAALQALPANSILTQAMTDYGQLRAQVRVCKPP